MGPLLHYCQEPCINGYDDRAQRHENCPHSKGKENYRFIPALLLREVWQKCCTRWPKQGFAAFFYRLSMHTAIQGAAP
jgi:hypothetical protein